MPALAPPPFVTPPLDQAGRWTEDWKRWLLKAQTQATIPGTLTLSGAFAATFTLTAATNVTFPTTGTLLTSGTAPSSILGTANQITASAPTGAVTLSLAGPHNFTTLAANAVLYGNLTSAIQTAAVNATATNKFLSQISSGVPAFTVLVAGDVPDISATYSLKAGNSGLVTVGTLTAGSTGAGFTIALSVATVTGTLAASHLVGTDITTVGTLTAGATGAGFTVALSSSTITGTLADGRLSANVPLLNAANAFTNTMTIANTLSLGNLTNQIGDLYLGSNATPKFFIDGAGTGNFPSVLCRAARGTQAARSNVINGDTLSSLEVLGYSNGFGFDGAQLNGFVDGTFTAGQAPPTGWKLLVNVANAVPALALTIHANKTVDFVNLITRYNNIATGGWGVPAIYGAPDNRTGLTAADGAPITIYTVIASNNIFRISSDIFATAAVTGTATYTIAWTENATAQTMAVTATAVSVLGTASNLIRPDTSTTITAQLTGVFTGTFTVAGFVEQLA